MRKSYRFIINIVQFKMKLLWNFKIINKERLLQIENCVIAANHISLFDPPFIGSIFPKEIHYLAKAELFKNKILGKIITYVNAIPIRRGTIDRNALNAVESLLNKGDSILLFPEGTRKSSKVKAGIGKITSETGKNILPVYIQNSDHLWQCFFRKKKLVIVIGEIIDITEFQNIEDRKDKYRKIAEHTLKKIYELKNECENS
ncbi:MAG: 1-acyl-sn-glycerol-3-phosphate acyltransferase [Candidatus Cloacimonetes bacterium]|nr:1-acyl-sn-glycerol-3-phosphate acyltransferase [Candidatus Cloacimonadota bacterium]